MRPTAAIDIGSNTVHLLLGVARPEGCVERLDSRSELLELGREVERHGRIRDRKLGELRHVLRDFMKQAGQGGARAVLIAATGALRKATNGKQTVAGLARIAGVPAHILSSRAEARLTLLGAETEVDAQAPQVLIDSGGASTEVVLTAGRRLAASCSIALGASLLETHLKGDPPGPLEWSGLVLTMAEPLKALPSAPRPTSALAVGGTAHRIEELRGRDRGATLVLDDLEQVVRRLLRHSAAHISRATGLERKKITLVAAGALILHSILRHYELEAVRVSHLGLREGIICAFEKVGGNWWRYL